MRASGIALDANRHLYTMALLGSWANGILYLGNRRTTWKHTAQDQIYSDKLANATEICFGIARPELHAGFRAAEWIMYLIVLHVD